MERKQPLFGLRIAQLLTQEIDQANAQPSAVKVLVEIEQLYFQQNFAGAEGRPHPDVGDAVPP